MIALLPGLNSLLGKTSSTGTWMCSKVYHRIESAQKKKDNSGRKLSSSISSSFSG